MFTAFRPIPSSTLPSGWRMAVRLTCTALLLGSTPVFAQSTTDRAVRDGVSRLVQAYGANDLDTYFSIYAKDMTVHMARGRWTHQDYHNFWTEHVEGGGGNRTARVEDLVVQVLPGGESAVATFRMPVESRIPEGADPSRDPRIVYYMTTVWALRNASWNIVHVHWSVEP